MGIEIRCKNPKVPDDETNTCWRVTERVLKALKKRAKVSITITKNLPVQGGLGAGSSNAVATMVALERELGEQLEPAQRLAIAREVGSDLPLFLVGGTILGIGRGEQVFPLPDLQPIACVVATPPIAVSTPKAFADWDEKFDTARDVERKIDPGQWLRYNRRVQYQCVCLADGYHSRCSRQERGPGRDTASRPRPCRDRKRLRTRRLSSISRTT